MDLAETAEFVTALASLAGYRSAQITLGIEPRWLLIFACRESDDRADAPALARSLAALHVPPRVDAAALTVLFTDGSREKVPAQPVNSEHPAIRADQSAISCPSSNWPRK